jgi:hypothetical protein
MASSSSGYELDATTGKYTVFINGLLWNACAADADCPGLSVCALNVKWAAYPHMCVCPPALAWTGTDCAQLNSWGMAAGALSAIAAAIACLGLLLISVSYFRLLKSFGWQSNALHSTAVLVMLANFSVVLEAGPFTAELLQPSASIHSDGLRHPTNELVVTVGIALSFFFVTASALNISLVWIAVADAAQKMSKRNSVNAFHFRWLLVAYYLVFFAGMLVFLVALGNPIGSALFAVRARLMPPLTWGPRADPRACGDHVHISVRLSQDGGRDEVHPHEPAARDC